ncbi:hypothetical protein [Dyadobacter sp. CY326]|uniref:hypothetical protein n=1 Tax=Dyadobacter sp. CY326 TaxID=2907300 RepID=UPI001F18D6CF|nr:hypothetical protein [Dyadobacter sp. CY326]MCE7067953.1 hypothetical protein [Dyadobacter sp. CY326]
METLIIQGEGEQISTLKAFLATVGISYKTVQEEDTTDYLLSNSTNKTQLLDSIQEAKDGKTRKLGLDDIWK